MSDVSKIITAIEAGEVGATDELLPLIYDELRRLAEARLNKEFGAESLTATVLVHEAYELPQAVPVYILRLTTGSPATLINMREFPTRHLVWDT